MQEMGSPEAMLQQLMQEFSVEREVAIMLAVRAMEASLRVEGEFSDSKVNQKMAWLLVADSKNRTPWFVSFMQAHYRKNLPAWIKLNDEAIERGQDPVTKFSVTQDVIMALAEERVKLARLAKEGKSIEEVTEAAFAFDDQRSDEELCSLLAEQVKDVA